MKRIPCIAIVCLILTLSGCAVKSAANAETVCDPGSGPEPPQFCLAAELPSELQRSAEDSAEGCLIPQLLLCRDIIVLITIASPPC